VLIYSQILVEVLNNIVSEPVQILVKVATLPHCERAHRSSINVKVPLIVFNRPKPGSCLSVWLILQIALRAEVERRGTEREDRSYLDPHFQHLADSPHSERLSLHSRVERLPITTATLSIWASEGAFNN
jgi:hypothetical protein